MPDIFTASLLISYFSFSLLILSSIVMIKFYILSKMFLVKHEELSDTRVLSITKRESGFAVHFIESQYLMNDKCNLLKFSFDWNFPNRIVC